MHDTQYISNLRLSFLIVFGQKRSKYLWDLICEWNWILTESSQTEHTRRFKWIQFWWMNNMKMSMAEWDLK